MRKVMVEIQCSRCDRKDSVEYDASKDMGQTASTPPAVFTASLKNVAGTPLNVLFDDLCSPCHRSVSALLEQIGKRIEGMSPDRIAKPKEAPKAKKEEPAPPPAPAPRPQPTAPAKSPGANRSS